MSYHEKISLTFYVTKAWIQIDFLSLDLNQNLYIQFVSFGYFLSF